MEEQHALQDMCGHAAMPRKVGQLRAHIQETSDCIKSIPRPPVRSGLQVHVEPGLPQAHHPRRRLLRVAQQVSCLRSVPGCMCAAMRAALAILCTP